MNVTFIPSSGCQIKNQTEGNTFFIQFSLFSILTSQIDGSERDEEKRGAEGGERIEFFSG